MKEKIVLTVSQANSYIKRIFDENIYLCNLLLKGEISNFKAHSSGHMYMSLKDDKGVIRAVMFRSAAAKLSFRPENGMKVIAGGRISVYERDGQYQMYIETMQPDGVGALHIAFEQLKEKLNSEGLFDVGHKKPLPRYPKRVGVITAPTGAAIRDILNILSRRFPYAEVILYPVLVQGENAAPSIVRAIEYMDSKKLADVLIVGRGGGSIEDLWAFNEEMVARAIYECETPIVSAVGHEVDFTISDFVADLRAPTPSAAAELVVPVQSDIKDAIEYKKTQLCGAVLKNIKNMRVELAHITDKQPMKNPLLRINDERLNLDRLVHSLERAYKTALDAKGKELAVRASRLDGLSPLGVLGRGFAVVKNGDTILKSVKQAKTGDRLGVTLADGEICAVVE